MNAVKIYGSSQDRGKSPAVAGRAEVDVRMSTSERCRKLLTQHDVSFSVYGGEYNDIPEVSKVARDRLGAHSRLKPIASRSNGSPMLDTPYLWAGKPHLRAFACQHRHPESPA